jgi:cyanophycinase
MQMRIILFYIIIFLQGCSYNFNKPTFPGNNLIKGGNLFLVGGGFRPKTLMKHFVDLANGGTIIVLPLASERAGFAGAEEAKLLRNVGAKDVRIIHIDDRRDSYRKSYIDMIRNSGGVWFTGGDQVKIVKKLLDTPLLDAIIEMRQRGGVVGGTSAGTACQSDIVITGKVNDYGVVSAGNVETTRGLGLIKDVILDQHFVRRNRSNRLLSVVLENPNFVGIGIDESTAIWVKPDGTIMVLGSSVVMMFDAMEAKIIRSGNKFIVNGIKMSILSHGDIINLYKK